MQANNALVSVIVAFQLTLHQHTNTLSLNSHNKIHFRYR